MGINVSNIVTAVTHAVLKGIQLPSSLELSGITNVDSKNPPCPHKRACRIESRFIPWSNESDVNVLHSDLAPSRPAVSVHERIHNEKLQISPF